MNQAVQLGVRHGVARRKLDLDGRRVIDALRLPGTRATDGQLCLQALDARIQLPDDERLDRERGILKQLPGDSQPDVAGTARHEHIGAQRATRPEDEIVATGDRPTFGHDLADVAGIIDGRPGRASAVAGIEPLDGRKEPAEGDLAVHELRAVAVRHEIAAGTRRALLLREPEPLGLGCATDQVRVLVTGSDIGIERGNAGVVALGLWRQDGRHADRLAGLKHRAGIGRPGHALALLLQRFGLVQLVIGQGVFREERFLLRADVCDGPFTHACSPPARASARMRRSRSDSPIWAEWSTACVSGIPPFTTVEISNMSAS